ncbi:MAG: LamG-like jellyroll fold domain-containing protein, partial [Mongoliitalea sp.]
MKRVLCLLGLLTLVLFDSFGQNIPAFPGAEGFGKYTTGGRGGAVYIVTNLNDSGPGSLRWALEAREPRIVVFEVSGTIELQSRLVIRNGNLTIAGQTAPGDGITVKNYPIIIRETGNIVVRFIRSRLGDLYAYHPTNPTIDEDAFSIVLGTKIIIDHCSFSWGTDEVFSIARGWDITLQNSIISEPLGKHNPLGSLNYGDKISYYKNLYAHARIRNPAISPLVEDGLHDIRNILVYNWGFRSIDGGAKSRVNITNSYFKPGPGTTSEINSRNNYENFLFPTRLNSDPTTYGKFFVSGNYLTTKDIASNQWLGVRLESTLLTQQYIESIKNKNSNGKEVPFYIPENLYSKTLSAHEAYEEILNSVGASLNRDIVDKRLINEVKTGTVTYNNSITGYKGIIDSQEDIGGWPILQSLPAPLDTDRDGMPDEWEIAHGLDPNKQDHNGYDLDAQYTNIEVYINSIVSEDALELTLPGRPTLLAPAAHEVLIADQVGFEWNLLNENKSYQLQVATDSTFTSLVKEVKGIEGAGLVLSDLAAEQTYFWRIRKGSDEQSTAWSEMRSFTLLAPFSNTNSEGLVGHWKMDEGQGNTLVDASGNNNHATLLNTNDVAWEDAVLDLGLQFPGTTNRFATKAHNPSLRFEKALTIAGWVKPTRFGRNTILNKNQDGKGFELSLENDGTIAFRVNRNGTASNRLVSKFNYEAHLNQWIHVSATFNGTSSKIYINGELDSQANFSERDITSLGGDLVIGALGTIQRFTGTMDDLRLYDRALTAEEVLALYLLPESLQKPASPILSNPANGQQQLSKAVVFSWEEVSNADSYILQVSSSVNFDQELKDFSELTTPTFSTDQLAFGQTYFWRVQAINANGSSEFSEIFTFETLQAPGKVTLIGPSHQTAGLTIPVELSWEATTRASSYHVQIAFDEAFANLFSDQLNLQTTQIQLTDLSEGTIYFWRVRAENEAGFGSYSDIRNFSTLESSEEESSQGESDEGKGESGDSGEENEEGTSEGESGEEKGQGGDDSGEDEGGQDEGSEESTDEEGNSEGESEEEKGKGED